MSIHGEHSIGATLVPQFPFSELEKKPKNNNNSQESKKS